MENSWFFFLLLIFGKYLNTALVKNQQKLYQVKNLSTDDEIVRKSSKSVNFKGSNYFSTYS